MGWRRISSEWGIRWRETKLPRRNSYRSAGRVGLVQNMANGSKKKIMDTGFFVPFATRRQSQRCVVPRVRGTPRLWISSSGLRGHTWRRQVYSQPCQEYRCLNFIAFLTPRSLSVAYGYNFLHKEIVCLYHPFLFFPTVVHCRSWNSLLRARPRNDAMASQLEILALQCALMWELRYCVYACMCASVGTSVCILKHMRGDVRVVASIYKMS